MQTSPNIIPMTNKRRDILLRLIDGCNNNVHIAHQLTRYKDCDGICAWIIQHGYAGENLCPWLRGQFNNSILTMVAWIVAKNSKQKIKPILLGRDWN